MFLLYAATGRGFSLITLFCSEFESIHSEALLLCRALLSCLSILQSRHHEMLLLPLFEVLQLLSVWEYLLYLLTSFPKHRYLLWVIVLSDDSYCNSCPWRLNAQHLDNFPLDSWQLSFALPIPPYWSACPLYIIKLGTRPSDSVSRYSFIPYLSLLSLEYISSMDSSSDKQFFG